MVLSGPVQEHVAVGNLNLDISLELDRFPRPDENLFARRAWIGPGGAATNYAVAVARLGHSSVLVARTGGDAVKLGLLDMLEEYGVYTGHVRIVPGEATGTVVVIMVPRDSTRTLLTIRGANEALTADQVPDKGDIVHFASVKPRVVLEYRFRDRLMSYDPGGEVYRDPGGVLEAIINVDTVFLNEKELNVLLGGTGMAESLFRGRLTRVVVKQGRGGATLYTRSRVLVAEPPRVEDVVDVTGAGDAFDAAFNVAILAGASDEEALRWAVAAGAAKVSRRGSVNMPSPEEVAVYYGKVRVLAR